MMTAEIISIIGATSGVVAVAGMIYGFGVKFSKIETKVNLIWSVFIEDSLRNQVKSGMLIHHSPYQRTPSAVAKYGEIVPPDILLRLRKREFKNDELLSSALIKAMGYEVIRERSRDLDITVHDFIALGIGSVRGIDRIRTQ